ncbi:HNH endonuclease [Candidatus Parabeggiatoa sp. HSG14]|uniref:HNH endonuclease n=1 Tax=Candidatus Parabeggiatoa sp. HSG14 TaxID=3055593 RepID=UPI0025A83AE1|nr:HNH endonuclease [Thiotrichales bacterium HSG14]
MSITYIPVELRRQVRAEVGQRCGYCQSTEVITGIPLEVEHIIPESLGGKTVQENLWLACHSCNKFKGNRIQFADPLTKKMIPFFNPRTQNWSKHFHWNLDGTLIIGDTPNGRATIEALRLNNEYVVKARCAWVIAGWHPPID